MHALQRDCLVIGGGVAGCALALLLARRGVAVTLADDGRAHHSGPFETVLAGTRAVWQRMGLLDDVAGGVEVDPLRHGAIWGGDELLWRDDPEPGLLLQRGPFDAALRAAAARAGVQVCERAPVRRLEHGWLVEDQPVAPRVVAFATGRRDGVPGLPDYQRCARRTLAVTLRGLAAPEDRGTAVVEAVADGWLWTHAPTGGLASVAALLDAEGGEGGLRARVQALLDQAVGPAARLRDVAVVRANDASPRVRPAGGEALVLGDAAGTIDPLASQGVEKAVAAADHAAAAVLTALEQPELWPRLRAVHASWERDLCELHWRTSAGFYEREVRFSERDFWRLRSQSDADREGDGEAAAVASDTELRWRPEIESGTVLLRHGDRFASVDGLRDGRSGAEVARIGRVPCAALWGLLATWTTLDAVLAAARTEPRLFLLTPRDVHDAVQWLFGKGWLVRRAHGGPATHPPAGEATGR